jgi:uncharacterized protein (TIGR02246 family)
MMNDSDAAIDALYDAWRDAFRRGDVEAIFSLLTEDYVLWAPGTAAMGIDAMRPRLAAALAAYEIEIAFEREERMVSGDLAVERGWDVQNVRPRAGGAARVQRQRIFVVLRRMADGTWRFARGISQPGPDA